MEFCGEIVFAVSDSKKLEIDFGEELLPTRIIIKGEKVALERYAPANRWTHVVKFESPDEYIKNMDSLINKMMKKKGYIKELISIYEEVSINVYIRSDYAEIGYSLPVNIIKKIAELECPINYSILSFGQAYGGEL